MRGGIRTSPHTKTKAAPLITKKFSGAGTRRRRFALCATNTPPEWRCKLIVASKLEQNREAWSLLDGVSLPTCRRIIRAVL